MVLGNDMINTRAISRQQFAYMLHKNEKGMSSVKSIPRLYN